MMKKNFDQAVVNKFFSNSNKKIVEPETLRTVEAQKTYQENEVFQEISYSEIKTQGKKGEKLPRLSMRVSPRILNYLKLISKMEGMTVTEYVNLLAEKDYISKIDYLNKVQEVKNSFK